MKRWAILCGVPVLAALFSIAMGKDANWDFLNYRWYTPYALLHGRLLVDVLVAEHATFYNPLLELPFYLIATHTPAIVAGFFLALAASVSFVPLCLLAEQCLKTTEKLSSPAGDDNNRFFIAATIALCGLLGGGVLGQIGIVSWDLPLASLTLLALYLLVRNDCTALRAVPIQTLLLAGFLSGSAAGFKLTAAIYPLGIAIAILIVSQGRLRKRFARTILFSIGGAIGMGLFCGYWMAQLWHDFGNPVFPYFNDVFHSHYATAGGNRDGTFLPHGIGTVLAFPFLFSANSLRVAEYHFRDIHIALGYALIILAVMFRSKKADFIIPQAAWFLFVFAAISFVAWEYMFAIYRYILPLELLSPLLIVLAIGFLPVAKKQAAILAISLLIIAQCAISTGWNRRSWDQNYVTVNMPYTIPANATVLLTGNAPMGFAVTALPDSVPALRIGSYLAVGNRFAAMLHSRVDAAGGPFLALFSPGDEAATQQALSNYKLAADFKTCQPVISNVSDPLYLCPVSRQ